ncbi:hypothetical protein [Aerosakkonema funiforme]|uniref:Uncharacterized protein n=1 Tax=Aerosakkonema funiforme FACHB-1375 TaxID=2949571 RepID=A0A926VH70_9CYAN|nr:hypothetical protein [Aerosakkonema funiforme]MBD2183841.1 hypothetical protein [Aerosakkonema funiforme FACHB-1375]
MFSATSRLRIEIDGDNFCIERWLVGLCYQKVRERTANIERIKLQKLGFKYVTACVVRSKQRQYRFGLFLSQKEKQWLVEELNNFLFISDPQGS